MRHTRTTRRAWPVGPVHSHLRPRALVDIQLHHPHPCTAAARRPTADSHTTRAPGAAPPTPAATTRVYRVLVQTVNKHTVSQTVINALLAVLRPKLYIAAKAASLDGTEGVISAVKSWRFLWANSKVKARNDNLRRHSSRVNLHERFIFFILAYPRALLLSVVMLWG